MKSRRILEELVGPPPSMRTGEVDGMDFWLDNLATLLMAIRQRRMTSDQLDRYARLLELAQRDALALAGEPKRRRL